MKNIILLILLNSILVLSCSSSKLNPKDAYIQLTKKRCFGKCPVYDLSIYKNGTVVYNGIDNVVKKGKYQFKISDNQIEEIEKLFDVANFKSLRNSIDKNVRDLPITLLRLNDKKMQFQGQKIPDNIKKIIASLEVLI